MMKAAGRVDELVEIEKRLDALLRPDVKNTLTDADDLWINRLLKRWRELKEVK